MTTISETPRRVSGVVGQAVPNVEREAKTSGSSIYAGDVELPGLLHARILRSTHPHARANMGATTPTRGRPNQILAGRLAALAQHMQAQDGRRKGAQALDDLLKRSTR